MKGCFIIPSERIKEAKGAGAVREILSLRHWKNSTFRRLRIWEIEISAKEGRSKVREAVVLKAGV